MSYTPGPWTWGEDWPTIDKLGTVYNDEDVEGEKIDKYMDLQLYGKDGKEIIPVRIDHYEVIWDGDPIKPEDRRLIAAAPDLLVALKAMRFEIEEIAPRLDLYPDSLGEAMNQADAAISKAEGTHGR